MQKQGARTTGLPDPLEIGEDPEGDAEPDLKSAQQLLDLPPPPKFALNRKELETDAVSYWRVEALLELCHTAPSKQTPVLESVVELMEEEDVRRFVEAYADFNVVDLWLYEEDVELMERVSHEGLQELGPARLGRGIPLGNNKLPYQPRDTAGLPESKKMILCKAAVGRMLPGCEGGQIEKDLHLPTGYHSLYVPAQTHMEVPLLAPDLPAYWADNYFVPNSCQVLVTHLVTYTMGGDRGRDQGAIFTPRTLQAMPAVVDECKFCGTGMPTDRFCRETGMAACMDCKNSGRYAGKNYTFDSVTELTAVMEVPLDKYSLL